MTGATAEGKGGKSAGRSGVDGTFEGAGEGMCARRVCVSVRRIKGIISRRKGVSTKATRLVTSSRVFLSCYLSLAKAGRDLQ